MWHQVRFAAVAVIVVAGLAACEPPPPPVELEVNSLAAGRDADPGDGVCETAPGNGECTVAAAIDEGNAAGRAVIQVPGFAEEPENIADPMTVSGDLTLVGDSPPSPEQAWFSELRVEPGGILRLESVVVVAEHVQVDGTLLVDRSVMAADHTVTASGRMLVLNSVLFPYGDSTGPDPAVVNHGLFSMRFSMLAKDAPVLHTAPGATSRIGASLLGGHPGECTGAAVVSDGYNENGPPCVNGPTDGVPDPDGIPVGELGCGTDILVDAYGDPRPGPGRVGCTPGPHE